jgi:hypothetical protein
MPQPLFSNPDHYSRDAVQQWDWESVLQIGPRYLYEDAVSGNLIVNISRSRDVYKSQWVEVFIWNLDRIEKKGLNYFRNNLTDALARYGIGSDEVEYATAMYALASMDWLGSARHPDYWCGSQPPMA